MFSPAPPHSPPQDTLGIKPAMSAVIHPPQLLLHGRQVSRLLQDHDRIQSRPDGRPLRRLLYRSLPADRRQGSANRRMFIPAKGALEGLGEDG